MAFLAVTSLMRTLELQFLHPQPRVILTNKEQIKSLHEKLDLLLVFLEKKANSCAEMKQLTEKIREVSVKAEDDIEAELLNVHHYHKLDQTLQRVVQDVEELMQITRNTNHLVNNNPTVGGSSQRTSNVEDAMVGHSKELQEVKYQLLRDSLKQRQVMAMVGMGGIGKTIFAKRIYDDPIVKSHFDLRAWTTMSQEHNKGQALLDLCRCIMPMSSTFNNKMEGDLEDQLRKSLLGERYLIIVDDIWTTEAWDDIQRCFPDDNNGSRILLTTRDRRIAQYANSGEYSYKMRFLNTCEGWDLFYQKFLDKEFLKNKFETIGRNIVQKCGGFPLTIVVLSGLLSTINKSKNEWETVETIVNSLVTLNLHEQFSRIFTLSYNYLPSYLKGCFLYLGVFHEDGDIPVKKLIRLWIAEGFVETMRYSNSLEEVGEDYLQDLIDRSLVMVHGRSFDGKIKTCRMHDLLHELCKSKAKEENLLFLETTGSSDRFDRFVRLGDNRWLSLKIVIPAFHLVIASARKCRSILCFNMVVNCDREWYLLANSFKKLRVLDLSKIDFKLGMPPDITGLVFLRYLALSSSKVLSHIPLWKNWNLQTLIIREDDNGARKLPHGIWDLPQLRHLEIYHQVSIDLPKVVQENLQTLYWLSTSQCTMEVFLRIPNVKELGIIAGCETSSQGLNNLCCLNRLEKLRVLGSYRPLHLPPQANIFPQNLKKLTFVRTLIPWEAMSIISMLPNLEVLKLKNFACVGQEWKLIEGGFRQLKILLISLTNLKEWKANEDSPFPKLERLLLRNCFELKEMPKWIEDIITLRLIKLEYCYSSLGSSAQRIKEEQLNNYGNDILDVLDFNTRPDEDHAEEEDSDEQTSLWFEARKLRIAWGHDPRYWIWTWDSGYEVAKLKKVSAFEIRLTFDIRCLYKMTCYSAYLVFKLEWAGHFLDVDTALAGVRYEKDKALYGWMHRQNWHTDTFQPSMKATTDTFVYQEETTSNEGLLQKIEHNGDRDMKIERVRVEGGNHNIITVFLAKTKSYGDCGQFPDSRSDGWMEIKLGDFYVSSGNEGEVELQLWHTSNQFWMSGFVVRGIEIRPAN